MRHCFFYRRILEMIIIDFSLLTYYFSSSVFFCFACHYLETQVCARFNFGYYKLFFPVLLHLSTSLVSVCGRTCRPSLYLYRVYHTHGLCQVFFSFFLFSDGENLFLGGKKF